MQPAQLILRPRALNYRFGAASVLALMLSLPAAALSAQQSRVIGLVQDQHTGAALVAARVRVVDLGLTTTTNATGHFSFSGLRAGTYTIEVDYIGYPRHIVVARLNEQGGLLIIELERRGSVTRAASASGQHSTISGEGNHECQCRG